MNGEGHGHDINKGKNKPAMGYVCFPLHARPSPYKSAPSPVPPNLSDASNGMQPESTANQQIEEEDIGAIHQWPNQHRNKVENRNGLGSQGNDIIYQYSAETA